jgi:HD-GYP domain-containing protein (c-di-GMP phosphodiesterase class II)
LTTEDWKADDYIPYHSVNVCILSIEVGLGLGYSNRELIELGVSALLHDVGMAEYMHLSNQPRKLTAEEYSQVKEHTISQFQKSVIA